MRNIYNKIKIEKQEERGISLTRSFESWGDKVLGSKRQLKGGRVYYVVDKKLCKPSESGVDTSKRLQVRATSALRLFIGHTLKWLAITFNSELKAKYDLIEKYKNGEPVDCKPLYQKKVTLKTSPEGNRACNDLCFGCYSSACRVIIH